MHSLPAVVLIASLAFVGTMCDNYFAFAAQLLVTDRSRYRRVSWAQASGILFLILVSAAIGSLLAPIPTRWIGVFAIAPWALAAHAWRHRDEPTHEQFRRGALTTFTLTLALGGDNIAVWIPLLRANGAVHALVTVVVFAAWEIIFVLSAQALVSHPRVVTWGDQNATSFVPWIYVALGVLILVECGTFR
ncbi:MAG: cadmium resistance transporter [Acidimicrobiales bacterium]